MPHPDETPPFSLDAKFTLALSLGRLATAAAAMERATRLRADAVHQLGSEAAADALFAEARTVPIPTLDYVERRLLESRGTPPEARRPLSMDEVDAALRAAGLST